MIEEKNPLKQGLKLMVSDSFDFPPMIEEKNPLKQGLKHKLNTKTTKEATN